MTLWRDLSRHVRSRHAASTQCRASREAVHATATAARLHGVHAASQRLEVGGGSTSLHRTLASSGWAAVGPRSPPARPRPSLRRTSAHGCCRVGVVSVRAAQRPPPPRYTDGYECEHQWIGSRRPPIALPSESGSLRSKLYAESMHRRHIARSPSRETWPPVGHARAAPTRATASPPRVYLRQVHLATVLVDFAPENEVAALSSVFATSETLELADASRAHPAARCATNTTTVVCLTGISIILSDMFVIVTCSSSCRGACRAVIIAASCRRTSRGATDRLTQWPLATMPSRAQEVGIFAININAILLRFRSGSRFDMQQIIASRLAFEYPFVANK